MENLYNKCIKTLENDEYQLTPREETEDEENADFYTLESSPDKLDFAKKNSRDQTARFNTIEVDKNIGKIQILVYQVLFIKSHTIT